MDMSSDKKLFEMQYLILKKLFYMMSYSLCLSKKINSLSIVMNPC